MTLPVVGMRVRLSHDLEDWDPCKGTSKFGRAGELVEVVERDVEDRQILVRTWSGSRCWLDRWEYEPLSVLDELAIAASEGQQGKPFTDTDRAEFLKLIARKLVECYGLSENDASSRVDVSKLPGGDLMFHEAPEHWAGVLFHGRRDFWRT